LQAWKRVAMVWFAALVIVAGCASPASTSRPAGGGDQGGAPGRQGPPKKVTAAMMGNPPAAIEKVLGGGSGGRVPGMDALEQVVGGALAVRSEKGVLIPRLADAVPSIENGLWKVFPDGHMETTWRIHDGVRWHDGTPMTSEDFVFSALIEQDKDLPIERNPAWNMVSRIEAPDPRTVTVVWKSAFIEADDFYSRPIFPKHLLEKAFGENKDAFFGLPYWNEQYVGAGPYRIQEWVRDSHVILRAYDAYVPGKPKIDEIELRFLADENAFMANILADTVDMTLGKSITLEQTLQVKEQWRGGRIETQAETAMKIWPQFVNTNPAVVTDVRFRKAMMYAMNRQEMVDGIMSGLSTIAHTMILPDEPELAEVDSALVKYEYDPRRAAQLIEGIGYAKGPDSMYRDGAGVPLRVEISATAEDQNTKPMFAVADYWQKLGVGVDTVVIPTQRQRDREYRATFPGFTLQGGGSGVLAIKASHGSQARLPENSYTGSNYSRYQNPEFDALIDRFLMTIPHQPRMEALRAVVAHMTDQLSMMNIYYAMSSTMLSNRLVAGRFPSWNIHEVDVKS